MYFLFDDISHYYGTCSLLALHALIIETCSEHTTHYVQSEFPLVGNEAPDFEAEAVFDQEFIKVGCEY